MIPKTANLRPVRTLLLGALLTAFCLSGTAEAAGQIIYVTIVNGAKGSRKVTLEPGRCFADGFKGSRKIGKGVSYTFYVRRIDKGGCYQQSARFTIYHVKRSWGFPSQKMTVYEITAKGVLRRLKIKHRPLKVTPSPFKKRNIRSFQNRPNYVIYPWGKR